MDRKDLYESHIKSCQNNFVKIVVPDMKIKKIEEFVTDLIVKKEKEAHHLSDNRSHFIRYFTGTLGEVALEEYLGFEGIVDWEIGNSEDFHKSDLRAVGLNVGVKTVRNGYFPIIFKKSFSPEIIMIKKNSVDNIVYLCGFATKDILNKYQSDDLIIDQELRKRGTKTGFYGFNHLQPFKNFEELSYLTKKNK